MAFLETGAHFIHGSFAAIEKGLKKYDGALKTVFKENPEKLRALGIYRNALKKLDALKTPVGTGSDTQEKLMATIASEGMKLSPSVALNVAKSFVSILSKFPEGHRTALLNRAAFDPDFAYTLILGAKKAKPDIIEQRLKGHLAAIGLKTFDTEETARMIGENIL